MFFGLGWGKCESELKAFVRGLLFCIAGLNIENLGNDQGVISQRDQCERTAS